jgi:hypothetical protein
MNAVLAGIFPVPLRLTVEIGDGEGFGKFHGVPMRVSWRLTLWDI